MVPASMARMPRRASSSRLLGASAPMPPICIPMELKLAKPHKAKGGDDVRTVGNHVLQRAELREATSSFSVMRVPSRCPLARQSCRATPMTAGDGREQVTENLLQAGGKVREADCREPHRECHPEFRWREIPAPRR